MRSTSCPVPIEKVLLDAGASYVPAGGGWHRMKCPYHDEAHASASVNRTLNAFKCHACGVQGDSIKLLKTQEGLSYQEALNRYSVEREDTNVQRRSRLL